MPNIREYSPEIPNIQPTDRGVDSAGQAARRIGQAYETAGGNLAATGARIGSGVTALGDAGVQYLEHREISRGAAAFATKTQELTDKWNAAAKNADPNDPTVAQRYREQVIEPELEKMRDGFMTEGGQKFAEARIASLRTHLYDKSAADMATLASQAVKVNYEKTANAYSNTAMTDPSAVPHLLSGVDADVANMVETSPNLKGADAARVRMELTQRAKESIVKAGAIGAIQKSGNPEAEAERWGKKYPEFISGADLKALGANARQQIRADRIDRAYFDQLREKEAQRVSDATETKYLQRLYSDDLEEQKTVSTKAVVNDPNLTRTAKERMIGIVNRELKPETQAQESNRNSMDLLNRLRLPEGDPNRITSLDPIYEARIGGKINRTDFDSLRKEFSEVRTPEGERLTVRKNEFLKAAAPTIDKSNPLMGKIDQDGKLNAFRLMVDLDKKIDEYRKAGKNPYDLMDPSKPDYMGTPAALAPYQKPLQQSVSEAARRLGGGGAAAPGAPPAAPAPPATVVPRKPNESPADYLRRTGGGTL